MCAWSGGVSAPGGLPGLGGCFGGVPGLGGVCSRGGCAWSGGVSAPGGVPGLGGCLLWGVPGPGGVSAPGGCIPACTEADTLPPMWTEFLTHACENITLAQLRCGR